MILPLALAVLVAGLPSSISASARPRLELTQAPNPATTIYRGITLTLTLINESAQPVELPTEPLVPTLLDAAGVRVAFADMRDQAGFAPPLPPPPPSAPLRPGERRVLESYIVSFDPNGAWIQVPYGGAPLAPGRYKLQARLELHAQTRAQWIARYLAATPSQRTGADAKESINETAEKKAANYRAHWDELPTFWQGLVESNAMEFTVPAL